MEPCAEPSTEPPAEPSEGAAWAALDEHLLDLIMCNMSPGQQLRARRVNRHWREVIDRQRRQLVLPWSDVDAVAAAPHVCRLLRRSPCLARLSLRGNAALLRAMLPVLPAGSLPAGLVELDLRDAGVGAPEALALARLLASCRSLAVLRLDGSALTSVGS
eukprot:tig00000808_g4428.t1